MAQDHPRHPLAARPIASLNYLLTSHVWRQDHNGFSHQDPGFIDHVVNKKAEVVRVYLPPDANTLLSVADHCLRSRDYVNVDRRRQAARAQLAGHGRGGRCTAPAASASGTGRATTTATTRTWCWPAPGTCRPWRPSPPPRSCATHLPDLRVRVVNVVDLMRLQPDTEHPHGLSDREFDALFTTDRPVIFAYHGYPWLIHRLTYRRTNHHNLHVRGYKEEGTTTTPFDMVMLNDLDRFHLVMDVIDRVPGLAERGAALRQEMVDARLPARAYTREHGETCPRSATGCGPTTDPRSQFVPGGSRAIPSALDPFARDRRSSFTMLLRKGQPARRSDGWSRPARPGPGSAVACEPLAMSPNTTNGMSSRRPRRNRPTPGGMGHWCRPTNEPFAFFRDRYAGSERRVRATSGCPLFGGWHPHWR